MHDRAEEPRSCDCTEEADEQRQEQDDGRARPGRERVRSQPGVAYSDHDREKRPERGDVERSDPASAWRFLACENRRKDEARSAGQGREQREQCRAFEKRVAKRLQRGHSYVAGQSDGHDGTDRDPGEPGEEGEGADLDAEGGQYLRARGTTLEHAFSLRRDPATKSHRRHEDEAEEEDAGCGSEKLHPACRDRSAVARGEERVVGPRELERGVGFVERVPGSRLASEDVVDRPRAHPRPRQRGDPAAHPEEQLERRKPLERLGRRGQEHDGGADALLRTVRVEALERGAQRTWLGHGRDPRSHEVDAALSQVRAPDVADLEDLAARLLARTGQTSVSHRDEAGEAVDGDEANVLAVDQGVVDERHAYWPGCAKRRDRRARRVVVPRERLLDRQPEDVDAEAAILCGKLVDRALERAILRHEAAAEDRNEERSRESDPGGHEECLPGPRAQAHRPDPRCRGGAPPRPWKRRLAHGDRSFFPERRRPRYARVFERLPQSVIEHHAADLFLE